MVRYEEIARHIALGFEAGGGEARPIPSEHDLCELYGASRTTIRAALRRLEEQGLISRRQGKGTMFQPRRIEKALGSLVDFHTEASSAGRTPKTRVVSLTDIAATPQDAALFGAAVADRGLAELVRLRLIDDEPAVLQRSRLDRRLVAGIGGSDLEDVSLYRLLEDRHGLTVASVEETLDPVNVSGPDAKLIGVKAGTAVFRSHRIARDATGGVIEVSDNLIRGDLYRFTIRRQSPGTLS